MRTSRRAFVWSALAGMALVGGARPTHATSVQRAMGPEDTAVLLAQFETAGDLASLLTYLHRDAAAIIPEGAIAGWYRNVWFPSGPGPISVSGTTFYDWTWEVNGVTYPGTAEVAFVQSFADGSVVNDVVRLVEYDGVWHWFFGRNRDFVNEQIAAYTPGAALLTAESARAGASRAGEDGGARKRAVRRRRATAPHPMAWRRSRGCRKMPSWRWRRALPGVLPRARGLRNDLPPRATEGREPAF